MNEIREVPKLPPREPGGHKGTYGRVLVVAGSRGMSGAAVLTGTAVMRSGAGLCTIACPESIQPIVAAGFPCAITEGFSDDATGRFRKEASVDICDTANRTDACACGPGINQSDGVDKLVLDLIATVAKPLILDADALNSLAKQGVGQLRSRKAATILTPHPGEFARLRGVPTPTSDDERLVAAGDFSSQHGVVTLLKGHRTIVTDGERYFVNTTGNPGMATGGSGDVLTGVIAALIGQGLAAFEAAVLGAHIHGRAGDLAAATMGQIGMTALDILNHLPAAFREPPFAH